jgi:hypothetical protein
MELPLQNRDSFAKDADSLLIWRYLSCHLIQDGEHDDCSHKMADFAVGSEMNPHSLTFEIGSVSKSYEDLVEDARVWLECTEGTG